MDQTVMLPDISGKTESYIEGQNDRRVLDIIHGGGSRWIVRMSHYTINDEVPYQRDALVLYTPELDELTRWWRGVKGAVK